MRIIGIDPGSNVTGWGVIDMLPSGLSFVAGGALRLGTKPLHERLLSLLASLKTISHEFQPQLISIEQIFVSKNPQSALTLGHARGVAVVALLESHRSFFEYSPREIKQSVVGYGGASKDQVNHMVKHLLKLEATIPQDASDALAAAICHAHMGQGCATMQRVEKRTKPKSGRGLRWKDDSSDHRTSN